MGCGIGRNGRLVLGKPRFFLFTRFLSDHWTFFCDWAMILCVLFPFFFISVFKVGFHSNITRVLFSL